MDGFMKQPGSNFKECLVNACLKLDTCCLVKHHLNMKMNRRLHGTTFQIITDLYTLILGGHFVKFPLKSETDHFMEPSACFR